MKRTRIRPKPLPAAERERIKAVRRQRWEMDERRCVDCGKRLPLDGDVFTRAHMAHTVRRWKLGEDKWRVEVLRTKCYDCHIGKEHNAGGKPCPRKPAA